jgi:hypothetical protein
MSDELVKKEETGLATVDTQKLLSLLKSDGDYLPRLALQTAAGQECKAGKFPINHYALIQDDTMKDLGTEVSMRVLSVRALAMDLSVAGAPVFCYDPKEDENGCTTGLFNDIESRSYVKDSKCMFGLDFLVYLPSVEKFATFYFGTKTSRRDAPAMMNHLGKSVTCSAKSIKHRIHGVYWSISVMTCSEPLDLPDEAEVLKQIKKFQNPPVAAEPELAEKSETEQAR